MAPQRRRAGSTRHRHATTAGNNPNVNISAAAANYRIFVLHVQTEDCRREATSLRHITAAAPPLIMKKRSSEKRRHVVSWLSRAEWDQVLEYLYSEDAALQKFALHRISAWRSRSPNNSPVAVDCTADLVRCQVLDRSGQLSGDDLVLLYGAALVRFVNLITERQQGKVARPLRRLAGNLNIPEWVVNLRHDVTHRKLPTLKWCRKGCKVVLEWLQQEYWSRQLGGSPDEDWEPQSDDEDEESDLKRHEDEFIERQKEMDAYKTARDVLVSYEKEQFQVFEEGRQDKDRNLCQAPFADMSWLLGVIKQFAVESSDWLVDVMLEDGFLVPTAEQLETLGCDPSEDTDPAEPRVPQTFLRFWLPLLKVLNSPAFLHLLLEKLFAELKLLTKEQNSRRTFYISAWISEVLVCNSNRFEFHFETKSQKKARMRDRVFVNRIQLRWQQLLSACLDAPCVSTPHLLRLVLDDMEHPLPLETRQKLLRLCSIYTQTGGGQCPEQRRQPVYTLESLHEKQQQARRHPPRHAAGPERSESSQGCDWEDALADRAKVLRGSPWQVCTDKVLWKNFPLGKVPGQSDEPSCLMVERYSPMSVSDQSVEVEGNTSRSVPGVSGPPRTVEGPFWSPSDVGRLKSGLKLF